MEEWNMSIRHPAKALEPWLEVATDEELVMVLGRPLGVASAL
jgi:hypothetical protein